MNAVDFLLKPVEPMRLRQTVNRALERLERADLKPGAVPPKAEPLDELLGALAHGLGGQLSGSELSR